MQTHVATTPFGRRSMTLGQISSQVSAKAMPTEAMVNKWEVFQHIREAREMLGATDRALAVLNALLSFHRDAELRADGVMIVWPSNEQLMARANGISPATLRRHIAILVECGLVIRRDSPNGKRFARRGAGGEIEQAYGFDLSPIIARAQEFKDLSDAVQVEKRALRVARERLTLLRRDVVKMIDAGIEENVPGNWGRVLQIYQTTVSRLPRSAPRQHIEDICNELQELHVEIRDTLESFVRSQKMSANESHSERHIQNSNTDPHKESEERSREEKEASASGASNPNLHSLPARELPLGIVLDACPDVKALAKGGEIRHWRDFLAAAEVARPLLGVSPSAWQEACEAMGEVQAAITLSAILQRSDQINSAGGYLRNLTDKAREGKFSTWPMVMALLRAKLDASRSPAHKASDPRNEGKSPSERLEVSDALLRSLKRPR